MQDKVFVALKREPRQRPADRWTTWARSMSDRHERITARQGVLIMTLVQPFRMFTSINQRLENFALALFPRIEISIGPILQELARAQLPSALVVQKSLAFPRVNILGNSAVLENHAAAVGGHNQPEARFLLPASMTFAGGPFPTDQRNLTAEATGFTTNHNAAEFRLVNEAGRALIDFAQSPLRRLFARIYRRTPGVVLMVQEHLRVEQTKRGDMALRKQMMPGISAEDRRGEMEAQFASTKTRSHSWPENSPEVNVEQLTEQVIRKIDHRIKAYRERLGRAF